MMEELLVYLNGEIMEENRARVSPFDRGFLWGDGVYEITPCFNRRLYRLKDHLDRLYRSLRYVRIDLGMKREEKAPIPGPVTRRLIDAFAEETGSDYSKSPIAAVRRDGQ